VELVAQSSCPAARCHGPECAEHHPAAARRQRPSKHGRERIGGDRPWSARRPGWCPARGRPRRAWRPPPGRIPPHGERSLAAAVARSCARLGALLGSPAITAVSLPGPRAPFHSTLAAPTTGETLVVPMLLLLVLLVPMALRESFRSLECSPAPP